MKTLRGFRTPLNWLMFVLLAFWQITLPLQGATYFWDADGNAIGNNSITGVNLGGNGTWNGTNVNWWDGVSISSDTAHVFTGSDTAAFFGSGGTIVLTGPVTVGSIIFNQIPATSSFFITGDGTAASQLTLAGGAVAVNAAGTDVINTIIAGSNGLNMSSTTTGTLSLTNTANVFSGGITISSGTLSVLTEGSLGNASNTITFNGSTLAAGLTLGSPMALNASRTITLNNTGGTTVTLTSTGNAQQEILGKVTGAGIFTIANGGTTYLLNSGNDFTGVLWAQTGIVSLDSLPDASGSGNIKLGSGGSTGGIQWGAGATTPLNLTNRSIELAGTTGGGIIDSSANGSANAVTINNLTFTTVSSGNKTLTLTGFNTGTNIFAANIINNGTSITTLTKSGMDLWVLTGTGSNYTGVLTINQGMLRVTNASGLGGTGPFSFGTTSNGQGLDIRSDAAPTGIRSLSNNSANNAYISLDHAEVAGNTTTDQTITFGTINQANSSASITFVGSHGYGVALGVNTLAASNGTAGSVSTYTVTSDLGTPGMVGYAVGPAEFISIAGFSESGLNTGGATQTLNGWGNFIFAGPISNTSTQPVNITKSGLGILTFSPTTMTGWNTGTLTIGGGTTRVTAPIITGGATVTLGGGLLELRNDASTNFAFNVANVSTTSTLFIDHSVGGNTSGMTLTMGSLTLGATTTLNVAGDHGYSLATGTVTQKGTFTTTIANYLGTPGYAGYTGGTITLGNITTDATAGAATLALAGFGDYILGGTISSSNAGVSMNITKSNLGVVTFAGNNSGWTSTAQGTLTTSGGTTLIDATNTNAVGSANLSGTAGMVEIFSATGTSGAPWTTKSLTIGGAFTLAVDPLAGSSATGQMVNLGGLTGGNTMIVNSNHGYGVTFNAVASTAAASTITNAGNGTITLAGGLTTTAAVAWTLSGAGDFNVSGNITNGTGTTGLTKSGAGTATLSGTNTIGGTLNLGGGILRVTNAGAFGGTGGIQNQGGNNNTIGSIAYDFRSDTAMDLSSRAPLAAGAGYNYAINVDHAIGGSGTNQIISIGGGAWAAATSVNWGYTATGANGYSLQYKGAAFTILQGLGVSVINNFIPDISGNGSIMFTSGITFANTTTATGLTLAGTGDFLLSGALTSQTGTTTVATLAKSGTGTLTISNDNSTTWNSVANDEVMTVTAGILRLTNGGGLGGANAVYNQNGGTLDLRSDAGITQAGSVVTVGATSTINVDRTVGGSGTGGTQTITSLKDNGVFTVFATGGTQSGVNAYNLGVTTFTVGGAATAAAPTLVNNISNGGAVNIATLIGANFATLINGAGNTNVSTAMTLGTGTLTKSGVGILTIAGPVGYAASNTNGAITVNGGTLALDFTGITAPNSLLQAAALTLGAASGGGVSGGTLSIKGAASGATTQTLSTLAVQSGLDQITLNPTTGTSTTLTFTGTITATNAGGQLLINAPANTSVVIASALNTVATTGRNVVFFDGTNYNWATNTGSGTATISVTDPGAAAVVKYVPYNVATTDTSNDQITTSGLVSQTTSHATNSLMVNTSGVGGTLALGATTLTLTQGGLLFTDSAGYTITGTSATTGLKSATATNSDLVINNYGTGTLTIQAPIIQGTGTSTLTLGGTGTTVIGNSAVLATLGTYTGVTYVNGGTVQLASGITGLGAAASNTALTQYGGTLDLNGNNLNIGSFNGGPAAVIDNTNAGAASLTIGAGNGTGTYNGTIKNTGGALTLIKAGTGTITLGDAVTGGGNLFTGNLKFTGASTLNINSLMDTPGTKVDFSVSGANLTFIGRTNLVLNNRVFDISAAGGSATITSSSVAGSINGTNAVMTIGSAFSPTGTGALSLTLAGSAGNIANGGTGSGAGDGVSGITGSDNVAVVNAFNGAIGNGAGTLALTITGSGGWSLGGNNTYSGGTTITTTSTSNLLVRATSATAFGNSSGAVNVTGTGTGTIVVDLRSDSSLTFANAFTMNNSFTINVDRAIGGSGYGQIMNIGTLTEATTGKTLIVNNLAGASNQTGSGMVDGYGLHIAGLVLAAGSATTIQNSMGSPGAAEFVIPTAGTGVAGALVIDGVTTTASLGAHTLTLGGAASNNFAVTVINGDITQAPGTTLGISVTGSGGGVNFITLAGTTAATNYSGGLTLSPGTGGATVRVVNVFGLGSGPVTFSSTAAAATLEVRSDTSLNFTNNNMIVGNTATARTDVLAVGEALNGSSGRNNTFTFGTLGFQGVTANALTVTGIGGSLDTSGNSVAFGGVSLGNGNLNGAATFTVTNNLLLPGTLALGNVTSTNTTTATTQILSIAGAGVTTLGDVTNSTTAGALTGLIFRGTGILDLSGATSATNYTGGFDMGNGVSGGTIRVTNQFGLGANTGTMATSNVVNIDGSILELRSDSNLTFSNQMLLSATGNGSVTVDQLPGGNGSTGVMFTLGQLKVAASGKTFAVSGIGGSTASSGDSVTLGGVDLNGIAAVITNNLLLPGVLNVGNVSSTAAGSAILTINGTGVSTVGDVTNGSGTVGLTYGGSGILDLSRMTVASTYSGGFTINAAGGVARVTNPYDFGTAAGISLVQGTIEIRSDTNFTYTGALNFNANTNTVFINVGEVGTGTTTGVGSTFSFGALTFTTASGKTLSFGGIGNTGASSSDSVVVNGVTFGAGGLSNAISNTLSLPGTLNLGNITGAATSGTVTLTIGGSGFTTIGSVSNGAGGGLVALTFSGTGILQMTNLAGSNFSGGFTLTGSGGILDIRTDANQNFTNALAVATNSPTINVDQLTSGNFSKTVTFNGATTTLATTAKTLTLISGSNYSIVFTNGFNEITTGAAQSYGITNNTSGTANLGAINFANSTTSNALTLGGTGYTIVGNITGAAPINTLTYSGTGFLDLTGNNAASNQVTAVTISGAGSTTRVNSATNLGVAGDTVTFSASATLQVRNDNGGASNGTINFGNNLSLSASGVQVTLDLGNTGGAAVTGNTVAFGALNNGLGANVGTLTVNANNGYQATFTSLTLPSSTGNNTTLVANAPVTISGPVTNPMTGFATTNFDTVILDGVASGSVSGAISDSATGSITLGGYTRVTKQGTGTWALSGNSTYTGPTTVNSGTLLINNTTGSGTGAGAVTVNGSVASNTYGTLGGTGTIAGTVTLASGGMTSYAQGPAINPGTIGTAGTLTINGALTTNNFSKLNFDLNSTNTIGGGINDLINTLTLPVINAATLVSINTLGMLTSGSVYTLISGYTGTIANFSNLSLGAFTGVDTAHYGVLQNNVGSVTLLITGAPPSTFYWSGSIDGNWNTQTVGTNATNWRTDATSNVDPLALPNPTSDVHFYTTTPVAGNLATTLGQDFTIGTLTFDSTSTSAVSISGNTLTIAPANSATGITLAAGAGAVTINSALVLAAPQTWTNNSTNSLTVTGVISGSGALAIAGGVTNITQQANTFSGNITIDGANTVLSIVGNAGGTYTTTNPLGFVSNTAFKVVTLTNGGTFSLASQNYNVNAIGTNPAAGQVFVIGSGGGAFNVASGSTFTIDDGSAVGTGTNAYELQGTGNLTKAGLGILVLRQQNAFTGAIITTAGTLKASGTTIASASAGITVQSGATLDLAGQVITDAETLTISGTGLAAAPVGVITNSSATAASIAGAVTLAGDSSIGGTGNITLSGLFTESGGSRAVTKISADTLTLSNTGNNYSGTLTVTAGTLSVASLANSGVGDNGTGNIVFNNGATAAVLTYTGSGSGAMAGRGITLQGSTGGVTINANGTGPLVFGGTNVVSTTGATTLTLSAAAGSGANSLAGGLSDGAGVLSLIKTGLGSWTLSGANSFTGSVTDNTGNLIITNSLALGTGPKTISIIPTTNPTSLPGLVLDGSAGNITLASNISFTTSFDALNAGVPIAGNAAIINQAGNNTINGNFTLTSGGGGTAFLSNAGNLLIAGNIAANTTGRTLNLRGAGSGQISGVISDGTNPVAVSRDSGTGLWVLTGANSYTGTTTVSAGTLQIGTVATAATATAGGPGAGQFTVNGGGTLAGTGTVRGNTVIQGSVTNPGPTQTVVLGVLAPGDVTNANTKANFKVAANLTVGAGGQLKLELGAPTTTTAAFSNGTYTGGYTTAAAYLAGTGASDLSTWNAVPTNGSSDYINVTGSLTLGSRQDPNQTPTNGFGTVNVIASGYTGNVGDVFNLLDWTGALNGAFATGSGFTNAGISGDMDLPTLSSGLGFDTSAFSTYGILVVVTVAPEPGRMMLLLFGLLFTLMRRRRKQAA